MKKEFLGLLLTLAMACAFVGTLSACNNKGQSEPAQEETLVPVEKVVTYENFPDVPDFGALAGIGPISTTEESYSYLLSNNNTEDVKSYDQALRDSGFSLITTQENDNGTPISFYDNGAHTVVWGVAENGVLLVMIEDSLFTSGNEASTTTSSEENVPATSSATLGEKNALKSAQSYIKYSDFSRKGLIEQLEFEGYSNSEAVYGADNCGADWYAEAVGSAASYLKYSSFSRTGLIEQLEYEGFTHDQAVYGVEQNGY